MSGQEEDGATVECLSCFSIGLFNSRPGRFLLSRSLLPALLHTITNVYITSSCRVMFRLFTNYYRTLAIASVLLDKLL